MGGHTMTLREFVEEYELELEDMGNYVAEVEVVAHEIDASFSHEFGTRQEQEIEVDAVYILGVTDDDGGDVPILLQQEKDIIRMAEERIVEDYRNGNLDR